MGFSYRKSTKVGKNSRVNVSSKSVGFSTGVKGARVSVNSKGKARMNFSIPGTGLRYTKTISPSGGLLMMCIIGIVNIYIWLIKAAFILLWWMLKVMFVACYYALKGAWWCVLWVVGKITHKDLLGAEEPAPEGEGESNSTLQE